MSIFTERIKIKPYEYPHLIDYLEAITNSYWLHTEFNYTSDIQDFKVTMSPTERDVMKRALLSIAQMEMSVKNFWTDIKKQLPKPEIGMVGDTFGESEVRHARAYAHLVEILGLDEEYEKLFESVEFNKRLEFLDFDSLKGDREEYAKRVLAFSLIVELVSLFSQFLVVMSFNKHRNTFKGVSNVVEATSKEEVIHGLFGIELFNIMREENPEWFDEQFKAQVYTICEHAFLDEQDLVGWIFQDGDLEFLSKAEVMEFVKNRMNNSLEKIGYEPLFDVDKELLSKTQWFNEEITATKHTDFFNKRSIGYSKKQKSITSNDLF